VDGFTEYYKSMPWQALPYENSDKKQELSKKFSVSGIPSFILLNAATGETIDAKGRETVVKANGDLQQAAKAWNIA
jgi:nucleoredoxin